jgi:phosphoglycolate phosphatase-like HAD superfamily hydrolase
MEPETEIVSDGPIGRSRSKVAKKASELESVLPADVVGSAGQERVERLPVQARPEQGGCGPEEIRELEVVFIEDSVNGVRSGKAAGCRVVAITTSFSRERLAELQTDYVVDSFAELERLLHIA